MVNNQAIPLNTLIIHIHFSTHPFIPVLCLPKRKWIQLKEHQKAPDLSKPLLPPHTGYYSITLLEMDIDLHVPCEKLSSYNNIETN